MNSAGQDLYPRSIDEISTWRAEHRTTLDEARRRLAQIVILRRIARTTDVSRMLAFKGGNALRLCHHSPRTTVDLDFSALGLPDDLNVVAASISRALSESTVEPNLRCKVHSAHRNPPGPDKTTPTYLVNISYSFPGDRHYSAFFEPATRSLRFIPVDVSINDVVCEVCDVFLEDDEEHSLSVCVPEDIMAEKLRAILQQRPRNRQRPQDVYDIARHLRVYGSAVDRAKVRSYLYRKSEARGIAATSEAFDAEIRARARRRTTERWHLILGRSSSRSMMHGPRLSRSSRQS